MDHAQPDGTPPKIASRSGAGSQTWKMVAFAVAVPVVGAIAFGLTAGSAPEAGQPAAAPASAPGTGASARRSQPANVALDPSAPPKWTGSRQPRWARDGSRTIAFQLQAENDVAVWMKRVRPVLVVRCLYRNTEVFVMTDAAANIEPNDGRTVRVSFDQGPEVVEQWLDSASARELFASDGVRVARQIAAAQTMRFGFTPYNAAPVVVDFDVRGFGDRIGLVAKTCGWKP